MISIFFKVGLLVRPREMIGHFGLPMFIDENVERSNIAHFFPTHVEDVSCFNDGEDKVPELNIIKIFLSTILASIRDLVAEQKWEILIIDLDKRYFTMQFPLDPHILVPLYCCEEGRSKHSQEIYFLYWVTH